MTSVLRRYAQIDPRIQYFTTIAIVPGWTVDLSGNVSPVMDIADFESITTYNASTYAISTLLKDLGRQITVYDSMTTGSPHIATFRQVMLVSQVPPEQEGISTNIAYICVLAAPGSYSAGPYFYVPALVARTG